MEQFDYYLLMGILFEANQGSMEWPILNSWQGRYGSRGDGKWLKWLY